MTEKVDKAWLDIARDAGRQDRVGEVYLLRAEVERLRAALQQIADYATDDDDWDDADDADACARIAKAALEPKP